MLCCDRITSGLGKGSNNYNLFLSITKAPSGRNFGSNDFSISIGPLGAEFVAMILVIPQAPSGAKFW